MDSVKCSRCGKQLKTEVGRVKHESGCGGDVDMQLVCPFCDKVFKNGLALRAHQTSRHGPRGPNPVFMPDGSPITFVGSNGQKQLAVALPEQNKPP